MHRLIRHPSAPLISFTIAAGVIVAGTFAPWLRSGSISRSSYDLLGLMARLDVAPEGFVSTLVRWWPVVPLLVTSAVVSAWWRWTSVAVVVAVLSVIYAGGVGAAIVARSQGTSIGIGPGPWICAIGGLGLLLTSLWLALTSATCRGLRAPGATRSDGRS